MEKGEIVAGNIKPVVAEFQWGDYVGEIRITNNHLGSKDIMFDTYRFVVDIKRWATETEKNGLPIGDLDVLEYVYHQKFNTFWEASKLFHYLESVYKTPELVEQYELQQQKWLNELWEDEDISEQVKELSNI